MDSQKSSLTQSQARLTELMQRVNYGRIEGLRILDGEPVFDPPPRVVREIKFGGDNGPRTEATRSDFALKAQVRDLFAQLEAIGDGVIPRIEVKHGLPFGMTVEEVCA